MVNIFIKDLKQVSFKFVKIRFNVNKASDYDYSIIGMSKFNKNIIIDAVLLNLDKRCRIYHTDKIISLAGYHRSIPETDNQIIIKNKTITIPEDFYPKGRIVSFSVYNNIDLYSEGAIQNAQYLNSDGLGGIFYIRNDVDQKTVNQISKYCDTIITADFPDYLMMFLRFLPAEGAEIFSSRDSDSRITDREQDAIRDWLKTQYKLHIMRDHPYHRTEILGGMWDCRQNNLLRNIRFMIRDWLVKNKNYKFTNRDADQKFLKVVYRRFKEGKLSHDEFHNYKLEKRRRFPTKRKGLQFVGMLVRPDGTFLKRQQDALRRS